MNQNSDATFHAAHDAASHLFPHLAAIDLFAVVLDRDGRIVHMNEKLRSIFGDRAAAMIGLNWFDEARAADERSEAIKRFRHFVKQGSLRPTAEAMIIGLEGAQHLVRWKNVTLHGDDGSVVGSISYGDDITRETMVDRTLRFVASFGWDAHDRPRLLPALAEHFVETLDCDVALIGALDRDDPGVIQTIAVHGKSGPMESFRYGLKDTPCADVAGGRICVHEHSIAQLFAKDQILVDMGAESYVGIPLRGSDGTILGLIALIGCTPLQHASTVEAILQAVAIRAAAELERQTSESRLRSMRYSIDHCGSMICWIEASGRFSYVNAALSDRLGLTEEELHASHVWSFDETLDEHRWSGVLESLREQETLRFETMYTVAGGESFQAEITANLLEIDGSESVFCFIQDITQRKAAQRALVEQAESERRLLSEIDHRVRNNLASLVAMIELSRRSSTSVDDMAATIRSRTQAIAAVHTVLAQSKWHTTPLKSLMRELVRPPFRTVVTMEGPDLLIPAGQAQAFGIVINELATNAAKYGAMREEGGRVSISWSIEQQDDDRSVIELHWEEFGPAVTPPEAEGGGLSVIRGLAKSELRGTVDFGWEPDGARHVIRISLNLGATAQFDHLDEVAEESLVN